MVLGSIHLKGNEGSFKYTDIKTKNVHYVQYSQAFRKELHLQLLLICYFIYHAEKCNISVRSCLHLSQFKYLNGQTVKLQTKTIHWNLVKLIFLCASAVFLSIQSSVTEWARTCRTKVVLWCNDLFMFIIFGNTCWWTWVSMVFWKPQHKHFQNIKHEM